MPSAGPSSGASRPKTPDVAPTDTHKRTASADLDGVKLRSLGVAALVLLAVLVSAVGPVAGHTNYVVRSGDTLSTIAVRLGVATSEVASANNITNPDHIRVGQTLSVPVGSHHSGGSSAPSSTTYTVKAGDVLGIIARNFGVSTASIVSANGLGDANQIYVGQVLTISGGAAVASSSGRNLNTEYPNLPYRISSNPARLNLIPVFEEWAAANGIPADLLMALAWHESGWNNNAVSYKGARGIGQLMPVTSDWIARDLIGRPSLDPADPIDNIRMSARFVWWLLRYHGSVDDALAGYYQGPASVAAGVRYDSTTVYVSRVQQERTRFQRR